MNKFLYILLFIVTIDILNAKDTTRLVWPPPPDEPKIEYISSVRKAEDLGIEKGFFAKTFEFLFGEEDSALFSPFGIHADKNRIYVTDISLKTLFIFDKKKGKTITVTGSDDEEFLYPIDVVSDSRGNIYVTDSVRAKVYVFEKDGDFSYTIAPQQFERPVGIAISADEKTLYVVDSVASKIHVTTLRGKLINSIGSNGSGNGQFNRPTFIDAADGKLYVSDSMNHRVQILDENGKYIHKFGQLGQSIGDFGSPRGISLDNNGNIYVGDTLFNTIQIFNPKGELLMVLGHYGSGPGEFTLPEDIFIDSDNNIYIVDTNNGRFQVFKRLEIE